MIFLISSHHRIFPHLAFSSAVLLSLSPSLGAGVGSTLRFDRMSCSCSGAVGRLPAVAAQTALVCSDFFNVLFNPSTASVSFPPKSPSLIAVNFLRHLKVFNLLIRFCYVNHWLRQRFSIFQIFLSGIVEDLCLCFHGTALKHKKSFSSSKRLAPENIVALLIIKG